jgi:serine/threonine protein kinase
VTEFMDGGSLWHHIHDTPHAVFPWRTRISIALQVATGMAFVHKVPLVHRDLKSGNIFLNKLGRAVVGDFGSSVRLRPQRPHIVISAFTGTSRTVESRHAGASINGANTTHFNGN